jgi:hypothetical protein
MMPHCDRDGSCTAAMVRHRDHHRAIARRDSFIGAGRSKRGSSGAPRSPEQLQRFVEFGSALRIAP